MKTPAFLALLMAGLLAGCSADDSSITTEAGKADMLCGDGSVALCEIVPPECPTGTILEVINGCFGDCVDPNTCEPPVHKECGDGTVALCEIVPPQCPPGTIIEVVNGCFGDCVDPNTCEPPAPQGLPCSDGSLAICEIVPPQCPAGTVVEIVGGCFGDCVYPDTCEPYDPFATEGTFKLYNQPNPNVSPSCDLYTEFKMSKAPSGAYHGRFTPRLSDTSTCEIAAPQFGYHAVFFSHPASDSCGAKTANFGALLVDRDGNPIKENGNHVVFEGRYTDNRQNICEGIIPALLVLEIETSEGTVTYYGNPPLH